MSCGVSDIAFMSSLALHSDTMHDLQMVVLGKEMLVRHGWMDESRCGG